MDPSKASDYTSRSQQAKHVTEDWVQSQLQCLSCGTELEHVDKSFLDFSCPGCEEQYELKSKSGRFGSRVVNSDYKVKIKKIKAQENPSFLFLEYNRPFWKVRNLFAMPSHVFFPEMILPRKPLRETAQRAGWVGSVILLDKIAPEMRVYVVRDGIALPDTEVQEKWASLKQFEQISPALRGWTLDVWNQIRSLPHEFTLTEVYRFENILSSLHPENKHVKEKIRQQLQYLRNAGFVEFVGKRTYRIIRRPIQKKLDA